MIDDFDDGSPKARGQQSERAYAHVRTALLNRRFRAGELLPVPMIASELNMSRQPVLQALRRLATENMVEIIPQVGCRVASHSLEQIADFYRLFAVVEGLAMSLAAERCTERQLRRLRAIADEIDMLVRATATEYERASGYRALNREFHAAIHQMAGAPEIALLSQSHWDRSELYIVNASDSLLFSDRLETAHAEHLELIEALAGRNAEAAGKMMSSHVAGFGADVVSRLAGQVARAGEPQPLHA